MLLTVAVWIDVAAAESAEDCAAIDDANERLACYDRRNPRAKPAPEAVTEAAPPERRTRRPTYQPEAVARDRETAPTPAAPAAPAPLTRGEEPADAKKKSGGLFQWREKVNFTSEIAALRRGEKQRMVFRLANGEIWMQNTARDLPFSIGDQVTIKSGRFGGYIMRSASGTSTRVRLLD